MIGSGLLVSFIRREDAEHFHRRAVPEDGADLTNYLRIEERELEAGGPN